MNKLLMFLALFSGGACAHKQTPTEKINLDACSDLLTKILHIQELRSESNEKMQLAAAEYQMQKVPRHTFLKQKDTWFEKENLYATQVSRLYLTARERGCLDTTITAQLLEQQEGK